MIFTTLEKKDLAGLHPREIRALIRERKWTGKTADLAEGYVQANLAAVPSADAFDFLLFCVRNPKPCPLLEVVEPGFPIVREVAPGADLRTDLPKYRVYEGGRCVAEVEDVSDHWREDLVGFLLGCSYSFLGSLRKANVAPNASCLYTTRVPCVPAGRFAGPMLVSMRPIRKDQVVRAVQVTSRFPATHGAPVHIGDPSALGIRDLDDVALSSRRVEVKADQVPVFWACGCTPQAVALEAKLELMITHSPGCCLVTDKLSEELAAF